MKCVWYLFIFHSSGTWSDRGLTIERNDSLNITMCQSTHLTSFAIMVDVQGAQTQVRMLTVFFYIYLYCTIEQSPLFYQLHWLWHFDIFSYSNYAGNYILEVTINVHNLLQI